MSNGQVLTSCVCVFTFGDSEIRTKIWRERLHYIEVVLRGTTHRSGSINSITLGNTFHVGEKKKKKERVDITHHAELQTNTQGRQ